MNIGEDATELEAATSGRAQTESRRAIEAVVMASPEPVATDLLAQLVEISTTAVEEICDLLAAEYEREGRGFVLVRVAGGYRFQTHPDLAPYVERFVLDGQHARLSPAALETLAIVAYKQPIGRAQLSAIRGVNVDATLRTLVQRGYVDEVDHEQTPGNPARFGTTSRFLERLGIDSLGDLPALGDFVPEANIVEALERGLRVPNDVGRGATVELDDEAESAPPVAESGALEDGAREVDARDVDAREVDANDAVVDVTDVGEAAVFASDLAEGIAPEA
ncbi:MAG TPA: SMC-Scp complex subunit ScpB [Acidimicrobiia bacterium]